jgi:hypothetical protein
MGYYGDTGGTLTHSLVSFPDIWKDAFRPDAPTLFMTYNMTYHSSAEAGVIGFLTRRVDQLAGNRCCILYQRRTPSQS